jgi:hypothetical protein
MAQYWVLDKDNVDFLMVLTGKTETELREMYEKSILFDRVEVFWQVGSRWYNMKVAGQYVHLEMLDRVVQVAIEDTIKGTIE